MKNYPLTKKAKIIYLIIGIACCIWLLIVWQIDKYKIDKLREHGVILNGASLLSFGKLHKSYNGYGVRYYFFLNGEYYEGHTKLGFLGSEDKTWELFAGRKIPFVVDTTNPSRSMILLTIEDFEKFRMVRPDSLNWYDSIIRTDRGFFDFF